MKYFMTHPIKRVAWLYPCSQPNGYTLAFSLIAEMRKKGIHVDEFNMINAMNLYQPDIPLQILQKAKYKYDAVFVLDLGYLNDSRIHRSNFSCPVVLLAGDNPQSFPRIKWHGIKKLKQTITRRSSSNYFGSYLGHEVTAHNYDGVVTSDKQTVKKYERLGVYSLWFPYWADTKLFFPGDTRKPFDVVTVMTPRTNRITTMKKLERSFMFRYSNGLGRHGMEAANHYRSGSLVFNKSNYGEITMRVPEAMACGALLLTDHIHAETGLYDLFEPGKEIVTYRSDAELFDKIDFYISNEFERRKIAECGTKKVLEFHTQSTRTEALLNFAKSIDK